MCIINGITNNQQQVMKRDKFFIFSIKTNFVMEEITRQGVEIRK